MVSAQGSSVIGIGYEGLEITEFVAGLVDRGITRLVDVRLTPISRKRGFSKTALHIALTEAEILYEHRRELGNPKINRAGFGGSASELRQARSVYAGLLCDDYARRSLDELGEVARSERVALMCFEADQRRCHRDVVLGELQRRMRSVALPPRLG